MDEMLSVILNLETFYCFSIVVTCVRYSLFDMPCWSVFDWVTKVYKLFEVRDVVASVYNYGELLQESLSRQDVSVKCHIHFFAMTPQLSEVVGVAVMVVVEVMMSDFSNIHLRLRELLKEHHWGQLVAQYYHWHQGQYLATALHMADEADICWCTV